MTGWSDEHRRWRVRLADAFGEINLRFITSRANSRRVTGQVTHFAGAKFSFRFRRDVDLERRRNLFGYFANRYAAAGPDIHGQSIELVRLGGEQIRARDVFHKGKVARLLTVLIKHGWKIVKQACAKNCDYAGVWIKNGLARPVGARIPQRDRRNTHLFSPKQD